MQQTQGFNFTEQPVSADLEFKKQKAAYLAQRNARKHQAQVQLRKECAHSSSSSSDDEPRRQPPPATKYAQRAEDTKTNSSQHNSPKPQVDNFRVEREKYKAERNAYKLEMVKNKQKEFGSSSSEDESVPAYMKQKLVENQAPNKSEAMRRQSKEEFGSNPFCSLNLGGSLKLKQNQLHPSAKLKAVSTERKSFKERYQVQIPSKKGVNIWVQQFLEIKQTSVELAERTVPIYDLTKIKLFFTRTQSGCYKLKITHKEEDLHFAVNHKQINELCMDHYYYLFARLVTLKLQLMGKKLNVQARPKLGLSEQQLKGAQITGKVRKSSFFGGWQEKIGVVNNSGLCIYKEGKQKPVMVVGYNSISELWTRFDFDNENLIVKFLHNRSKVQLSIPYENYIGHDNWLFHLYNLASK